MFVQPDPIRQYCIDLSIVLHEGTTLFVAMDREWGLFGSRYRDKALAREMDVQQWYTATLNRLHHTDRPGFERIRAKPRNPTWEEAWDGGTGRSDRVWITDRGYPRDLFQNPIMKYFTEMLDYVKALRLRHFPASPLSDALRSLIAERFHKLSNFTIDGFFIENGCLIDWWILPLRPTDKQSADRVLGWIDGLVLHTPDDLIQRLQTVYHAFRRYKGFPANLPRDDIQVELAALLQPASGTSLASHHFHPTVEQTAERFWAIGEYDTALFKVCVALDNAVQAKSGSTETGTKLMQSVFSANTPRLKVDPRFGNQLGFMHLFTGAMDAIRNPRAHHSNAQLSHDEALEWLAFLSALFRVLDAATI